MTDELELLLLKGQMFDPPVVGGVMIRGCPISWIRKSEIKYACFLDWWKHMGRLKPTDPQGWSSLSGPWVMRGRMDLIDESSWFALPKRERSLIQSWVGIIPFEMFYD